MKNKSIYIGTIVRTSIIFVFLIAIMIKNQNIIARIMILPFLLCCGFSIGKNICLIIEKKRAATIFSKLFIISFLVFWFGMLLYGSFLFIKGQNYFSLIFTVPFWIAGIYITRKYLFEIKSKKLENHKKSKFTFQIVVSTFLVMLVLVIGATCLFFEIRDTYRLNERTKDYLIVEGYYKDYDIYNIDTDGRTTYKLNYLYKVDGEEYRISTDYGVGRIPEKNSIREIKYNPNNPNEAIVSGTNSSNFLIYFGAFFTLVGSAFVLKALSVKGVFDKVKIDVIGTYVGVVLLIVGIGIILFQNGTTSSFIETVKSMGFWFLIPLLFIIVGAIQTIKCLFFKKIDIRSENNGENE